LVLTLLQLLLYLHQQLGHIISGVYGEGPKEGCSDAAMSDRATYETSPRPHLTAVTDRGFGSASSQRRREAPRKHLRCQIDGAAVAALSHCALGPTLRRSSRSPRCRSRHAVLGGRRHRAGALRPYRVPKIICLGAEVVGGAIDRFQVHQQVRALLRAQLRLNGRRWREPRCPRS